MHNKPRLHCTNLCKYGYIVAGDLLLIPFQAFSLVIPEQVTYTYLWLFCVVMYLQGLGEFQESANTMILILVSILLQKVSQGTLNSHLEISQPEGITLLPLFYPTWGYIEQ